MDIKEWIEKLVCFVPADQLRVPLERRLRGIKIGKGTRIGQFTLINCRNIVIGKKCYIGFYCLLDAAHGKIRIEDNSTLAARVSVYTHDGAYVKTANVLGRGKNKSSKTGDVIIGKNTFIGSGAIILPNVTLGEGCVIGAGAVVNNDVPPYKVAVGVPAKIIKKTGSKF